MQVETRQYEAHGFTQPSTELTQSKLDKSILNIIKKEGYITFTINKNKISSNGGNYLGVLYEVDVKGKTVAGDKETAIFIKSITPDFIFMDLISLPEVYERELFFYKDLSRIFENVQDEFNVPVEERFNIVKSYDESNSEAIILENMTRRGFKTWHRMDIVTPDMADTCIQQLARFHALSFVLKKTHPTYFNEKLKTLKTPMKMERFSDEFLVKMFFDCMVYVDEKLRAKVEKSIFNILKKITSYLVDEESQTVMCHGDYRSNNIMVKESEGTIKEAFPVDYQLLYYGCPILDFFYFIYTSTDHQFRKSHMARLKDLYYTSMETFLQYFDIDIKTVFPRNVFEKVYKEKLDYGLMVTIFYVPFILVSEDDVPDITTTNISECKMVLDDSYKGRLEDAIQECIEWGMLDV